MNYNSDQIKHMMRYMELMGKKLTRDLTIEEFGECQHILSLLGMTHNQVIEESAGFLVKWNHFKRLTECVPESYFI